MNAKVKVARLSLLSNSILITLKLIVGLATGSVSIISEAIHSTMDLLAAIIAFFSVKISDKPADDIHPYGHGKIENVSGVIEAILILSASIWIIIEAVKKINNSWICGINWSWIYSYVYFLYYKFYGFQKNI
ncbi:cation diffusion facilitator family transporter [Clostridium beijerinckii]|uniref:cation diffusion facilitator family transporter n=1 Tax=Clostridium beijerinckii TaxID=1520 RepID=UPI00241561C5|nr:cation diffusion facilitator family transporter [Clostridium beijerinckii]NRZ12367.1 cation diffusion facilitator family transporter [Clostridium beijerinckii]